MRAGIVKGALSTSLFIEVGDKLLALAEHAYVMRQVEQLEELSQALFDLPLPDRYTSAARYFHGLGLIRKGKLEAAKEVLAAAAADPAHRYTARAILSLGATFFAHGDFDSALRLYSQASRVAAQGSADPLMALDAQKNIAVLKSGLGDHRGALADLERISSFAKAVRSIRPQTYFDYQNSLAVELGALGRLEEGARASSLALSSPFAVAYPEYRETFDEIASKQRQQNASRSAVAVRERVGGIAAIEDCVGDVEETTNLLRMPSAQYPSAGLVAGYPQSTPARVLNFQHWKTTTIGSSRPLPLEVTAEQRGRMTTGEKLIRLMDLISQDETDDATIDRILEAVEQIVLKRRGAKLD
jgi:tetratricopeptide (TPR) repeat protein